MKAYKPFKTVVKGKKTLSSAFKLLQKSIPEDKKDEKQGSLVAILTEEELKSNPPQWYKRAAENDSFVSDLKASKSAWIYHKNNRILLSTYDDSKTKDKDSKPGAKTKAARSLAVKIMQALHAKKITHSTMHLSEAFDSESLNHFVNTSVLMNYKYNLKEDVFSEDMKEAEKKEKTVKTTLLENLQILTPQSLTKDELKETKFYITAAHSALYGRDVINTRGSVADPDFMEERIREVAEGKKHVSQIHLIKGNDLHHQGLDLFYNVGKAATSEPRLMSVYYQGNPESDKTDYAIVGKGLTYDTGGLHLKPTGFMETMYWDKGGAVATLGALKGIIDLQLPLNIAFTFGIAENAIDARSYKPGDIIKSLKGLTVSIGNTDAEGRLVLADAMTWTQRKFNPKYMVDLATLTGACMVALGNTTAGLFSNDEAFVKRMNKAGDSVYEDLWRLPIKDEHREIMKGDVANLDNSGKGRYGGASTAAAFLENFVEKGTKWIHCDLAGPAYLDKPNFPQPAHGTGFGVQTLLKMFKDHKE